MAMKTRLLSLMNNQNLSMIARRCFSICPRLLLVALFAFCGIIGAKAAYTKAISAGALYYKLDLDNQTAQVVYNEAHKKLTGAITVPLSLTYSKKRYEVKSIASGAFQNCTNITEVTIPESCTEISYNAFSGCTGVTKLVCNASVASMSPFARMTNLELATIYLSSNYVSNDFQGHTKLREIRVSGTYTYTRAGAFEGCTALKIATINASTLQSIGARTFKGCSNLEMCYTSTQAPLKTIGSAAFKDCVKLSYFIMYNRPIETIESEAFYNCTSYSSTMPKTLITVGDYAFAKSGLAKSIALYDTKVTHIGKGAFMDCKLLPTCSYPSTLETIGEDAFRGNILFQSALFYYTNLKSIGANAFRDCSRLTGVGLPTTPNTLKEIGEYAFANTALSRIDHFDISGLTTLPEGVFRNCKELYFLDLPEKLEEIYPYAFEGSSLVSVTVPEGVTWIGTSAFSGTKLKELDCPDGLTKIGQYAFENCKQLARVSFGKNMKYLNSGAFRGCDALKTVTTTSTAAIELDDYVFQSSVLNKNQRDSLLVNYQLYDAYKAQGWEAYFNLKFPQITGISVSPTTATIFVGKWTQQMNLSITPVGADGRVVWSSSNPTVASVDAKGLVTGLSIGTTNIIAHHMSGRSAKCIVTVKDAESVSLSATSGSLNVGETTKLTATVLPAAANQAVTWESDNPNVATVSDGTVRGVGNGHATITATTGNGKKATYSLWVSQPGVGLNYYSLLLRPNQTNTLTASIAGGVYWTTSNSEVATVGSDGKLVARSEGAAVITATSKNNSNVKSTCIVTVTNEEYIYVGNIYYKHIEDEPDHLKVTNMGLEHDDYYALDAERGEYSGTVTIPSTIPYNGKTYSVTQIGKHAFYRMRDLQMVVLPPTIEIINEHAFERSESMVRIQFAANGKLHTIKNSAFKGCSKLNNVTLPNTVKTVEDAAFRDCISMSQFTLSTGMTAISPQLCYNCDVLDNLTLPNGIVTIGREAFRHCPVLKNITYASNLSMIDEYAFANCNALSVVNLPSKVAAIQDYAYYDNPNLTSVSTPATLEGIGAFCFGMCQKLQTLTFRFTRPVTFGESAFYNCHSLKTVNVANLDAWVQTNFANSQSNPTYFSRSLSNESGNITTVFLGNTVRYINQYAFLNMKDLVIVVLPASVTAISDYAFKGCERLNNLRVGATTPPLYVGVRNIGNSANDLSHIYITVPDSVEKQYKEHSYWGRFNRINTHPTNAKFPAATNELELGRRNIPLVYGEEQNIVILSGATSKEATYRSENPAMVSVDSNGKLKALSAGSTRVFVTANGLKDTISVQVLDKEPMYVGSIYYTADANNTASVTNMAQGLAENYTADNNRYEYGGIIELPSKVTYGGKAYTVGGITDYGCFRMRDLQKVYIPTPVTTIGSCAFEKSRNMQRIEFATDSKLSTMRDRAFYNCSALNWVTLPNGLFTIDKSTFRYCYSLANITLPSKLSMIDEYGFANCRVLKNITLPSTTASIQNYCFAYDSVLVNITIPYSMIGIGAHCFHNNIKLESIRFANHNAMTVGESAFYGCKGLKTTYVDNLDRYMETNFYNDMANATYFSHFIGKNNKELQQVTLPSTTRFINQYALVNCSNITEVDLPASISTVSDNIFLGCDKLTRVLSRRTTVPEFIGTRNPAEMQSVFNRATLYVFKSAMANYKKDSYWKLYSNIADIEQLGSCDVNKDGMVNSSDIVAVYNYIQNLAGGENVAGFDVNRDGLVNSSDIVAIYNNIMSGK